MRRFTHFLALICGTLQAIPTWGQTLEIRGNDLAQTGIPGVFIVRPTVPDFDGKLSADDRVPGSGLLASLVARGLSAGFGGLVYENRDRGHSTLPSSMFPGLTRLTYDEALKQKGLDVGLAARTITSSPLVGNASMAMTHGLYWRSLPRLAMTSKMGPEIAYAQYAANSLYIYPEHRDHDDRDLFPANWPYSVTTQGSSGSDQPFLKAMLMTLAAFPDKTRATLEGNGQIASTLTMIMRRTMAGIETDADYMTGKAHPSAFDGDRLRPGRMIAMAAGMRLDNLPPVARIVVEQEDFQPEGDLLGRTELLFTTPAAIGRVWRDTAWQHEMVVSAEPSFDTAGRPLSFHWALLRGDSTLVQIEHLDDNGTRARLTVSWHEGYPAPSVRNQPSRLTSRVDIGLFADNGQLLSAPAFISITFPVHQLRRYETTDDGGMRLHSIDYDAAARSSAFDPRLFWTGPWRDEMLYDASGQLTGWLRNGAGQSVSFNAKGELSDGRAVRYVADTSEMPVVFGWHTD
ncbi:MAG: hypothetical protein KDK24_16250 [Pseudooceanicola sp.]|nr:hypothetical protein [Pseudooceanicola sp.]